VAIAGPNGAGKSTFYASQLAQANRIFINADVLAAELSLGPYQAAELAENLRRTLLTTRESFVFETVFSDPEGSKLAFLEEAVASGYEVTLCFIGLGSLEHSQERVAMRVSQGGHDIPDDKLEARFPRTLLNLQMAIHRLPEVRVYDNSDLRTPYRLVAVFHLGEAIQWNSPVPVWLSNLIS
jgi:predicted ABC-type ATPase